MTRINPYQPQFNAGELSRRMAARTDFSKYANGVAIMENNIPLPEGGSMRRSGSRFVKEIKTSSLKTRLKRFEFSTEQAYILEMGSQYIRFFRNQGQIVTPSTDAQFSNQTFDSDLSGWSDQSGASSSIAHNSTDNRMQLLGTSAADNAVAETEVTIPVGSQNVEHSIKFQIVGTPNNKVLLRIGTSSGDGSLVNDVEFRPGFHIFSFTPSSNVFVQFRVHENQTVDIDNCSFIQGAALEIQTPYATADLFQIEGPQSADVLYFFHKNYKTHKLTRTSDTKWSLIEVNWQNGPWLDENTDEDLSLTPAAATGVDIVVTASGFSPFSATDVGRLIRINNKATGTDFGWAIIVSIEAGHSCTVDIIRDFQTTNAATSWQLGSWSSSLGYASAAAFFEQRLIAAANISQPQALWFSATGDFEVHQPDDNEGTVGDSDAFTYVISADDVNAIQWISPGLTLVIGATGGEWVAESNGASITPTDISIKRHTKHGSAKVQPTRFGHVILLLQKARRKIREFAFHFEVDGNRAFDMTRLARDVSLGGIVEMDFAQEMNSLLWTVRDDGQAPALTWLRDEDIVGWSRHIFGGSFGTGNAVAESVATIPGNTTTSSEERDEVWFIVKRTINGVTKRYVEFLERDFDLGDAQEDAFYVDSGLTYTGSATTEIAGLTHLIGETVKIWGDGAILPEAVVNPEGEVKLQSAVSKAQIGLGYTSKLKTLKLEGGAEAGTAVGKNKKFDALTLVLIDTHAFSFGPEDTNLIEFDLRDVSDPMDAGTPLFTGEFRREFDADFDRDARIIVQTDAPAPMTLLALAPEATVNDLI